MTMFKALVVDDESPARDELVYLLSLEKDITVVGQADSGPSSIAQAAELKPDVIFMDIEMRGMTGLETAAVLRKIVPQAIIIFATAYDHYAVKAFEIGALDYVLKPFEEERIHATLQRVRQYSQEHIASLNAHFDEALQRQKIIVKKLPAEKNGKIVLIHYEDIIYVTVLSGLVRVVTKEDTYSYNGTLSEIEERTRDSQLVRVHKSYLVNLNKVHEVVPWFKGTYWLKVEGCPDVEIPVSKNQIKDIKELLGLK